MSPPVIAHPLPPAQPEPAGYAALALAVGGAVPVGAAGLVGPAPLASRATDRPASSLSPGTGQGG